MKRKFMMATCFGITLSAAAVSNIPRPDPIKIQVCRQVAQLVRLSPNPSFNGKLTVLSESKAPIYFYVFDLEGTMVFHTELLPGEKQIIRDLSKGTYSYDVFSKDVSVEQGKIMVEQKQ